MGNTEHRVIFIDTGKATSIKKQSCCCTILLMDIVDKLSTKHLAQFWYKGESGNAYAVISGVFYIYVVSRFYI